MRILMGLLFVLLTAAGCGGSSGGGGLLTPPDAFNGTYGYAGFSGTEMTAFSWPRTFASGWWGTRRSDGRGMWELLEETINAEGGLTPVIPFGDPSGYLRDSVYGLALNTNRVGAISSSGVCGTQMQFTPPGIEMMCRRGSTVTPGDYALFLWQHGTPSDAAAWGTLTLTAGGAVTSFVFDSNTNGSILTGVTAPPGTYTAPGDGTVGMSIGTLDVAGTVDPTSDRIVLGGSSTGANLQALVVLVRLGSGASTASLNGDYDGVWIRAPSTAGAAPAWEVRRQALRFDGAGNYQMRRGPGSQDGRYLTGSTVFTSTMFPYTVMSDGRVVANGDHHGVISRDGSTLVLAGRSTAGTGPVFSIYVR